MEKWNKSYRTGKKQQKFENIQYTEVVKEWKSSNIISTEGGFLIFFLSRLGFLQNLWSTNSFISRIHRYIQHSPCKCDSYFLLGNAFLAFFFFGIFKLQKVSNWTTKFATVSQVCDQCQSCHGHRHLWVNKRHHLPIRGINDLCHIFCFNL